jgi:hypothetical protein
VRRGGGRKGDYFLGKMVQNADYLRSLKYISKNYLLYGKYRDIFLKSYEGPDYERFGSYDSWSR